MCSNNLKSRILFKILHFEQIRMEFIMCKSGHKVFFRSTLDNFYLFRVSFGNGYFSGVLRKVSDVFHNMVITLPLFECLT